jgi:hypothetical protein
VPTVTVAVRVAPPATAVIVTCVAVGTVVLVIVKAGDVVAPGATVTDDGTERIAEFELVRETAIPPAGAIPEIVTVLPPLDVPPAIALVERLNAFNAGGLMVRVV